MGSRALIFDEDTCATNFMIRDAKMAALVHADSEPITPFISRVRSLYTDGGVSSVLVVGGAGDYLNIADTVLKMKNYGCHDVTADAKAVVTNPQFASQVPPVAGGSAPSWTGFPSRFVDRSVFRPDWKTAVRSTDKISYGDDIEIRLFGLEQVNPASREMMSREGVYLVYRLAWLTHSLLLLQLVAKEQTNAILSAMHVIAKGGRRGTLREICEAIEADFMTRGLAPTLGSEASFDGTLARPRKFEIAGAISRLRLAGLLKKN